MALLYLLTTSVVLTVLLLYYYFTNRFNYWKLRKVSCLQPLPFFGNFKELFFFKKNVGEILRKMYQKATGPYVGIFILNDPCLLIRDPELVKAILVKDFQNFPDRLVGRSEKADKISAHLLFTMKYIEWKNVRYRISPAFSTGKFRQMLPHMQEICDQLKSHITHSISQSSEIEVKNLFSKYSIDLISSCAFGINSNSLKYEDAEFAVQANKLFKYSNPIRGFSFCMYFIAPQLVEMFRLKFVEPTAGKFLANVFWRMMTEREVNHFARHDLIDLLVKLKNEESKPGRVKLDNDVLLSQAIQFFFAGFETTSGLAAFTLYELAFNPDIQERVRKEIADTVRSHGSCTYDAIKDMKYLDMIIKEILRMYPTLPFLDRRCNENYMLPGTDLLLEKGTAVMIPMWGFHFDPKYFPDPYKFNPERFSEENEKNITPFTYFPFGEGPRICIGARFGTLAAKMAVIHTILAFRVSPCKSTSRQLQYHPLGVTLSPTQGITLRLTEI